MKFFAGVSCASKKHLKGYLKRKKEKHNLCNPLLLWLQNKCNVWMMGFTYNLADHLPLAFGVISSSCSSYSSEEIILDNLCCLAWLKLEFEEASSKSRSVDKKCRLFLLTWCIVEVLGHEDNIIGVLSITYKFVNIQLFLLFIDLRKSLKNKCHFWNPSLVVACCYLLL